MNSSVEKRGVWVAAAVCSSLVFSIPLFFVLFARGNYLPFANETLAYRYFINLRILGGEGGSVWLPQGQLVTLMQHFVVLALRYVGRISTGDLKGMLNAYGIGTTLLVDIVYLGVCFAACLDRNLNRADKALILVVGPAMVLGTITAGFYYSLLPDYLAVDIVLVTAAAYLTLRFYRDRRDFKWKDALIAGAFLGVCASNKLTLLGPAGVVAISAVIRAPVDVPRFFMRSAVVGLLAIAVFAVIFLGCYGFKVGNAVTALGHWRDFLEAAGEEPGFWGGNFWLFQRLYNYDKVFYIWIIAIAFLGLECWRLKYSRPLPILLATGFVGSLLVLALIKRGAGTTFFEVSTILGGLSVVMFALALSAHQRWALAIPVAIMIMAAAQFDVGHNWMVVTKSRDLARTAWEIRDKTLALARPTVIVVPDNSYTWGSIEELLDKGLRDLATAQFDAASHLKSYFAPSTDFRREPGVILAGTTLVWFEKFDVASARDLVEISPAEAKKMAPLTAIAAQNNCQSWRTGYSDQAIMRVCAVDRVPLE